MPLPLLGWAAVAAVGAVTAAVLSSDDDSSSYTSSSSSNDSDAKKREAAEKRRQQQQARLKEEAKQQAEALHQDYQVAQPSTLTECFAGYCEPSAAEVEDHSTFKDAFEGSQKAGQLRQEYEGLERDVDALAEVVHQFQQR